MIEEMRQTIANSFTDAEIDAYQEGREYSVICWFKSRTTGRYYYDRPAVLKF